MQGSGLPCFAGITGQPCLFIIDPKTEEHAAMQFQFHCFKLRSKRVQNQFKLKFLV